MAQVVQFFESGEESSWVLTTNQAAYVLGLSADGYNIATGGALTPPHDLEGHFGSALIKLTLD